MHWRDAKEHLYRAQQRLAITRNEAAALLALSVLLLVGMVVRHVQGRPRAVPGSPEAVADPRFQEGAARFRTLQGAGTPDTARGGASPLPAGPLHLDLNAAPAAHLERLPGVGPVIAERIVAYRTDHGAFAAVGDLERVQGIGPKTMARLAPMLYVETAEE